MTVFKSVGKFKKGEFDPFLTAVLDKYGKQSVNIKKRTFKDGNEWFLEEEIASLFRDMHKDIPFMGPSVEDLEEIIKDQDNLISMLREDCKKNHILKE
jgi:hypothetical protein